MTSPLGSIARTFGEDARGLMHNRPAFFGGLGGLSLAAMLAYAASIGLAAATGDDNAAAAVSDDFEIDFAPGSLARLGERPEPHELPQKIVIQDRRAPDSVPDDPNAAGVSRDANDPTPAKPTVTKPPTPPAPHDDRDPRIPVGPKPTHANTPHTHDLPTVDHDIGDPWGDTNGWSDLTRSGDAWATAVMAALAHMPVGWYAGHPASGDFRFQLTVCKDGSIGRINDKGGSMDVDGRAAVRLALEQLELPKITGAVAASMPSTCAKLKYTFVWSSVGVE